MPERIFHEPSAKEREEAVYTSSAELKVNRAVAYAEQMMASVPKETAGWSDLWMTYFYSYFTRGALFVNPLLHETIDHFLQKSHSAVEAAGTPWELEEELQTE